MSETTLTAPNDTALTQLGLGAFLRRHHGRSLVLVAQDLAHWYVGEVAASANQGAIAPARAERGRHVLRRANGYHLISLDFHRSAARERALLMALCEADIGGAIFLWDHSPDNLDLYERLTANCPCVQVIDPKPIAGLDFVGVDEYSGGMFAVRHLIHLGYRQIGHVTTAEVDDAAGRFLEPPDHPQGRGLSAARGAEQAEELTGGDVQRQVVDRHRLSEILRDSLEPNIDFRHFAPSVD